MAHATSQVLAAVATLYGLAAALAVLLQARQMLYRGGSCDVSARFLATYVGGYAVWLVYGLSLGNVPIVVVDALGLVCGAVTLAVALKLRGALLSPASWNQCDSRDLNRRLTAPNAKESSMTRDVEAGPHPRRGPEEPE